MKLTMTNEIQMSDQLAQAYEVWMNKLRAASKGERKRRLSISTNHAEKMFVKQVWWPAFGQFTHLHAEYEIKDFKDGWRYLDFAYITEGYQICIEIDGFGTHWRDLSRSQFADHLMRQNHLMIDGWYVLRFSYDDLIERPRVCQQIIQQLLGKLGGSSSRIDMKLSTIEQAIIILAASLSTPITPTFAAKQLGVHRTTVMRHIQSLVRKELLIPTRTDVRRICSYRLNKAFLSKVVS
ncbi:endonuclease domain-containing protein [Cohnella mopanensis]|uniref:endonuclease domain-containing protein n=1 Tax=Cohnella mopanensis TaxID=2911966 RepID=UPI001EF91CD0|nr:endonuclease domain-containing protein [Cohnella mopanensis]